MFNSLGLLRSCTFNNGRISAVSCRLFGIELRNNSYVAHTLEKVAVCLETISNEVKLTETTFGKYYEFKAIDLGEQLKEQNHSELSQKNSEIKQYSQSSTRSRNKVQTQGVVVGRAVDLMILEKYENFM